jgi:transposase-like protein
VEVDETHIGGIERNKHEWKKLHAGRGPVGKQTVVGLRERGGRTIAKTVAGHDADSLRSAIQEHVEPGSRVHTDEAAAYRHLGDYQHETVNHGEGEFARGDVTVNSVESTWALMKRGIVGVYHHVDPKHLGRYVKEFTFRLNEGDVKRHPLERLDSLIAATVGRRLTYAGLTA